MRLSVLCCCVLCAAVVVGGSVYGVGHRLLAYEGQGQAPSMTRIVQVSISFLQDELAPH